MSKKLTPMVGLLLASILLAFPQTPPQGPAQDRSAELQDLVSRASPHKGDLDEMDQRAYRTRIGHLQPGQLLPQPQAGPCRTGAVRRDSVFSGVQTTNRTAKENEGLFTSVCDILLYPLPAC